MWSRAVRERVRTLFWKRELEREFDEELEFHLEMQTAENVRLGMDPEEARRQAVLLFGGVEGHRQAIRDARFPRVLEDLWDDARYGARTLRRNPVFAAAAILTLALGIGVATAVFGVADQLFFRPLPLGDPERLVSVTLRVNEEMSVSVLDEQAIEAFAAGSRELTGLVGAIQGDYRLGVAGSSERIPVTFVSRGYFELLGVRPALGRAFAAEDLPEVVLSDGLWRSRYGGDRTLLGKTVLLDGHAFVVAGVAPKDFTTERVGYRDSPKLWAPMSAYPLVSGNDGRFGQNVIARLRDGATPATAAAELTRMLPAAPALERAGFTRRVAVTRLDPIHSDRHGPAARYVGLLGLGTGVVLLLAAINVAGMLLSRAVVRAPEIGVRLALGAGRGRIVRQLLSESAILFIVGGGCGVLLAAWLTRGIAAFPWPLPVKLDADVDGRAAAFGVAITSLAGLAAALFPALQAARPAIAPTLSPLAAARPRRTRMRNVVVVLQVALSLLLVLSSGLFLRALGRAWSTDLGLDPAGVVMVPLQPPSRVVGSIAAAQERIRAIPGVEAASLGQTLEVGSSGGTYVTGQNLPDVPAAFSAVSPGYFATLGIELLRGRDIGDADVLGAQRVGLVSASLARTLWPGEDPLGKQVGDDDPVRVVGVVSDVRVSSIVGPPEPAMYLPLEQLAYGRLALYLRTSGDAAAVYPPVREALTGIVAAPEELVFHSLEQSFAMILLPQRVGAWLAGVFGTFALGVAAIGLYGVLAYAVAQRRREIGVRLALGADGGTLVRRFVGQGIALAAVGIALGTALALGATRFIAGLLYGISPVDPATYLATAALVICVMAVASFVPARQAARVDAAIALRAE